MAEEMAFVPPVAPLLGLALPDEVIPPSKATLTACDDEWGARKRKYLNREI